VISDGLENGAVVSGVGGQFNFVTQAFALEDARSVLTLASTRFSRGGLESNIVWSYAHETIPRHLRDIIITEYGIADLRGQTDAEVIAAMLSVADSRFQPELLNQAKRAGKIAPEFEIPQAFRNNLPERMEAAIRQQREAGLLSAFPFGSDFTDVEQRLLSALSLMQTAADSKGALVSLLWEGWRATASEAQRACLERMSLERPRGFKERFYRLLLKGALARSNDL
jgi:hypothetical protein